LAVGLYQPLADNTKSHGSSARPNLSSAVVSEGKPDINQRTEMKSGLTSKDQTKISLALKLRAPAYL
jgi:hypothetical protein